MFKFKSIARYNDLWAGGNCSYMPNMIQREGTFEAAATRIGILITSGQDLIVKFYMYMSRQCECKNDVTICDFF